MSIDVTALLHPVSEDAPCGDDLEYDPAFGELERAALGTPERVMGDNVIPAQDPDWRDVLDKAQALLGRSKDLRVAVHLLHAGVRTTGLPALGHGLELIHRLVNEQWETVHPQLDREDGDDPTLRLNSLLPLNDRTGLIASLARVPLIRSRTFGRVTLRDIRIASGELTTTGEDGATLDGGQIDAAFLDGDLEELQANAEAVRTAVEAFAGLTAALNERVSAHQLPELGGLEAELKAMQRVLSAQLGRRGAAPAEAAQDGDGVQSGAPMAAAPAGEIRSREDVMRQLDRICEYFRRNEPSSPVPLLLQRAKGLVSKDFIEILNDLTPEAVSQARAIAGLDKNE